MNCKRSNCGHAINRHYGDEEQFCMMCSCVGYLSDFWEGSVIEPGKWYHEHTKEQLAGEIVRRGLRDSEVFTMSKEALVSALEIDDAKYGHNQGPRKIVEDPSIPEGKGFASEYLRACCDTPIGSEHRPECTVPTERTPETAQKWSSPATDFARKYHDLVYHRQEGARNYRVWSWDEVPEDIKAILIDAAKEMIDNGYGI